ncbi:hypothetical protein F511_08939 [Dorcoceras hygrometricum]|uniref:Uncharacterized protein n=1 Tax=Dorcoceras hygrometricum TaxID=472368 RepID=A0A2Z7A3T5_9LAMI|nr:hypothetical protein F511_08939 [Dorcoceras hygrometricum]
MSLFDLQDVCIAIGSLATLDLPMVVDLIGIYVLKGPYCTLTTTNWFLQALSVIPRGSWGDVARRFTMILRIDGGRSIPVVDRIGGSTVAYSLKCRFPRETGRSQAPRRQQAKFLFFRCAPGSGIQIRHRQSQQWYQSTGSDPSIHCCHNCMKSRIRINENKIVFGRMAEHRRAWWRPTARMCARGIARWPRDGQQLPADACCCSVQVVALLAAEISRMDAPPAGRCPVQWLHGRGLLDVRIYRAMMRAAVPHMLRRSRGLLPHDLLTAAAAVRPPSDDVTGDVAMADSF